MPGMIHTEKCTGCRSCEIACSYHHRKIFSRKIGSIEIKRWEKEGRFGIMLYRQAQDERMACDGCKFCLKYCPEVARDELKAVLEGEILLAQGAAR
jgi:ferredoxin